MDLFAKLFTNLDELLDEPDKQVALEAYFRKAPAGDAAWAIWLLTGHSLKAGVSKNHLRLWTSELSGYPEWMVAACQKRVGDLAEAASALMPQEVDSLAALSLRELIEERVLPVAHWDEHFQLQMLKDLLLGLEPAQSLLLNKMLTGTFRAGVTRFTVARALANVLEVNYGLLLHRLGEEWTPSEEFFESLVDPLAIAEAEQSCPHPVVEVTPGKAALVLIYAQCGAGPWATDFSSYTLAASCEAGLVAVAKATSTLTLDETQEVGRWIGNHTLSEKGPVRTTPAKMVFEVEFDGVYSSARHKSGLFIDSPRITAWKRDTDPGEITPLEHLQSLISVEPPLT